MYQEEKLREACRCFNRGNQWAEQTRSSVGLTDTYHLEFVRSMWLGFTLGNRQQANNQPAYNIGRAYIQLFNGSNWRTDLSNGEITEESLCYARAMSGSIGSLQTGDFRQTHLNFANCVNLGSSSFLNLNGSRQLRATDFLTVSGENTTQQGMGIRSDFPFVDFEPSYDGHHLAFITTIETYTWQIPTNAGLHTVRFEYANGDVTAGTATLTVGGTPFTFALPPTGGYTTYNNLTVSTSVSLARQLTSIVLSSAISLNLNKMELQRN